MILMGSNLDFAGDETMKMEETVKLVRDCHFQKTILNSRKVPVLFIIVCFLIIANSSCDHVGSTNVLVDEGLREHSKDKTTSASTTSTTTIKYDPLNMLREIYLDHKSKVITMILPPNGDQVQKFHPNGRYGRRSVDSGMEPHVELGRLKINQDSGLLRSILRNFEPPIGTKLGPAPAGGPQIDNNKQMAPTLGGKLASFNQDQAVRANSLVNKDELDSMQAELNKLLRCNYSGISNLYWCDSGN